ncbi:MAG: hypothetical protein Q7S87_09870 [Agitococcus sp.]|nr:hypothetical protein [Agitococcus sp.]
MDRAERRTATRLIIKKQSLIAKQHKVPAEMPGKFKKSHVMDCGRPLCGLCGNPRRRGLKNKDAKTIQELRHEQASSRDCFVEN